MQLYFQYTPNVINAKVTDTLNEISEEFTYNYLANSFGDTENNHVNLESIVQGKLGKELNARRERRGRCRNIVVIGAGASYDSYMGIPLGKQMIQAFQEDFVDPIQKIDFLREKFELEKNEIYKLLKSELDFENFLSLLSNFFVTQDKLRAEIAEHTGFRYPPSLFYEIIAHMLKHSFIDVVINFNFDELLDQCIEEEMGKDNYHFILSDGHTTQIEDILIDGRIRTPIYIKPHGTYGHKSSLRFTKRHYLDLPPDIEEMIGALVNGKIGKGKEVQRVNLICVGFDLASIEFNDILNKELAPCSRIYHFQHLPDYSVKKMRKKMGKTFRNQLPLFLQRTKEEGLAFNDIYYPVNLSDFNTKKAHINNVTTPLAEVFSNIWRKTFYNFKENYKPRSIARHELISYFFYRKDMYTHSQDNTEMNIHLNADFRKVMRHHFCHSPKYFRDRVMLEITIELLRNNGYVDIVELLKGRVGVYFEEYLESAKKFNKRILKIHSIYDILYEFLELSGAGELESFDGVNELEGIKLNTRLNYKSFEKLEIQIKERVIPNFKEAFKRHVSKKLNIQNILVYRIDLQAKINDSQEEFTTNLKNSLHLFYEEGKLACTILINLLSSKFLSTTLKETLIDNITINHRIYNGLTNIQDQPLSYSDELLRIFTKTRSSSFFNIRSKIRDKRLRVWESYQGNNRLHTNLILSYTFKETFVTRNWDCFLGVFESGETIRNIISENNDNEQFLNDLKKRSIVLLCCYEEVEQGLLIRDSDFKKNYHTNNGDPNYRAKKLEAVEQKHKNWIYEAVSDPVDKKELMDRMVIVYVPFWEHNQHISIFLKSTAHESPVINILRNKTLHIEHTFDGKEYEFLDVKGRTYMKVPESYSFIVEGGFFMYRRGFSLTQNTIKLSESFDYESFRYGQRDVDKLLLFFYQMLCRGIAYQVQLDSEKKYVEELVIYNLRYYRAWNSQEFYERMKIFMSQLYQLVVKNGN